MKKNLLKKMIAIIIPVILVMIFCISNTALADYTKFNGNIPSSANSAKTTLKTVLNMILGSLRIFAAGLAVIVITYLGAKYMLAASTEKAQIKSSLINFVIGVAIVEAALGIVSILKDFAGKLTVGG